MQAFLLLGCECTPSFQRFDAPRFGHASFMAAYDARSPCCLLLTTILYPYTIHSINRAGVNSSHRLLHIFTLKRWPSSARVLLSHGGEGTLHALVNLFRSDMSLAGQERVYIALHLIFAFCHPLVSPFFVASRAFMRSITTPVQHIDRQIDAASTRSREECFARCWSMCVTFSRLARLVTLLITLAFPEAQRRMFHQPGSVELAVVYTAAYD